MHGAQKAMLRIAASADKFLRGALMKLIRKIVGFGLLVIGVPQVANGIQQIIETGGDPRVVGKVTAYVLYVVVGLWLLLSKNRLKGT